MTVALSLVGTYILYVIVTLFRGSIDRLRRPHGSTCSVYKCRSVPGWSELSYRAPPGELPLGFPEGRPWPVNSSFDRSTSGRSCGFPEEFSEWWTAPCSTGRVEPGCQVYRALLDRIFNHKPNCVYSIYDWLHHNAFIFIIRCFHFYFAKVYITPFGHLYQSQLCHWKQLTYN